MTSNAFHVGKHGTFNRRPNSRSVILRIGQPHPAADQNDRPFGLLKFREKPPDLFVHDGEIETRGRGRFEADELFGIDECFLHVEGDVQQHGPRPSLLAEPQGLFQFIPDVVRLHNHLGVFGHWCRHCDDVRLLKSNLPDVTDRAEGSGELI